MTAIERFARHVANGGRGGSTGSLAQTLTLHLADTVLAWVAASRTAEGRALLRFESPGPGGAPERIMRNCALARLSEIDDIHLSSCTTPGAVIVPAVLSLSASREVSDRAAVTAAIVAGYEAMVRLGRSLDGPTILYRGIWPTYLCAPFGVAAACSRLLGFSERETAQALALALALAAPGVGQQSGAAMSRWLAMGHAARSGLLAAMSAKSGFTADLKMLEGEFFPSVYRVTPDPAALTDGLGERAAILDVSFKPWCAARQTMAATQGLREIIDGGVAPADITAIEVRIPPPYFRMVNHGVVAGDRASHLTSLPYQLACIALAPGSMFDLHREPASVSPEMQAFMAGVQLEMDESLLQHYPNAWPARIAVSTRAATHERLMIHIPGDPARPFDERQVTEKFHSVLLRLLGEATTQELLHASLAALAEDGAAALLVAKVERVCKDAISRS